MRNEILALSCEAICWLWIISVLTDCVWRRIKYTIADCTSSGILSVLFALRIYSHQFLQPINKLPPLCP